MKDLFSTGVISLPQLCLVRRDVTDVDVIFFEFQEGPIYTGGQSVSNYNTIKALTKFAKLYPYLFR